MSNVIQVKRGIDANRAGITPAEGEIIYTTDTKKVYIGDGVTAGGNPVSSGDGVSNIDCGDSSTVYSTADISIDCGGAI